MGSLKKKNNFIEKQEIRRIDWEFRMGSKLQIYKKNSMNMRNFFIQNI